MKKKKVLILGAKGMLGKELVKVFYKDDMYEVIAWDIENLDLLNKSLSEKLILERNPDIIINCVASNAVDLIEESDAEFEKAKVLNSDLPEFLAKLAKQLDAKFVQYITDYVFDGVKGRYDESDEPCPVSNYGKTKAEGEKKVKEVNGEYYLIRISKLFGDAGISEGSKKSFFAMMMELAEKNKELKVVDDEKSCFTYVSDLAIACKKLLEEGYKKGVYHLVNEGGVTWYEGLKKCFKIAGIDIKIIPVTSEEFHRVAERPHSSVLLNTKFPKLRSYEEALMDWLC